MLALSPYQTIMLCIMLAVAWLSRRHARGIIWLAAIAAGYFVSSMNWRQHGASPELVAGLCDALVCLTMFFFARRIWELLVLITVFTMLLINFVYLAHNELGLGVIPHDVYATLLELLNLGALSIIGGVSSFMLSGSTDGRAFGPWRTVFGVGRPFVGAGHRDRSEPPQGGK